MKNSERRRETGLDASLKCVESEWRKRVKKAPGLNRSSVCHLSQLPSSHLTRVSLVLTIPKYRNTK